MKRSQALAPLSRDHHQGLFVAQKLTRASAETAAEACSAFLDFWLADGSRHFRIEEELLLPAASRHIEAGHEAVVRVLVDHVQIRRSAQDLEAGGLPDPEALHALGRRLHDHIRHEERVLFPLIEDALPEAELGALGAAVERAERSP